MGLKWEHSIYQDDFSTSQMYKDELNKIIKKIKDDYDNIKIKHKNEGMQLDDMNSKNVDNVLDSSENLINCYKTLIDQLEELRGEIK